ncbi:MAG TPA: hypothetical protein VHF26_15410 [Trebonia sp.]|nr:hypothetical protein [Trebonia sp.]
MSAGTVILLVVVLAVVAAAAALASTVLHRRAVRAGTGAGSAQRRRRVEGLGIRPLSDERRAGYIRQWTAAQEEFIDSPAQATRTAGALVTAVAAECGYDVSDGGQLLADLSVYHEPYVDGYRRATEMTGRAADAETEDLRRALLGHRALFQDLLEAPGGDTAVPRPAPRQVAPDGGRPWQRAVPGLSRLTRQREDAGAGADRP